MAATWQAPGGSARLGGEPFAQPGDIVRAEAVTAEHGIAQPVQPPTCIGEVLVFQAGLELAGQADQLPGGIAPEGRGHVDDVAFFGAGRERPDLGRDRVEGVQDRADVGGDRCPAAVEVGDLQDCLLAAGAGNDPLG